MNFAVHVRADVVAGGDDLAVGALSHVRAGDPFEILDRQRNVAGPRRSVNAQRLGQVVDSNACHQFQEILCFHRDSSKGCPLQSKTQIKQMVQGGFAPFQVPCSRFKVQRAVGAPTLNFERTRIRVQLNLERGQPKRLPSSAIRMRKTRNLRSGQNRPRR